MKQTSKNTLKQTLRPLLLVLTMILAFSSAAMPSGEKKNDSADSAVLVIINDFVVIDVDMMDAVQPGDIESFSVLKDKSAVEKYGEKGRNGVILITLKKDAVLDFRKKVLDKVKKDAEPERKSAIRVR